jgi:hypothetical protein
MSLADRIKKYLVSLLFCCFCGITIIAIGIGSVYPPINIISKPFVCPNGSLDFKTAKYRPSPGATVTTTTWVCTDAATGEAQVLNVFPMVIPAGIIDGVILFVIYRIIQAIRNTPAVRQARLEKEAQAKMVMAEKINKYEDRYNPPTAEVEAFKAESAHLAEEGEKIHNALADMVQLKQMLEQGLITQAEFNQKKAEILKRM